MTQPAVAWGALLLTAANVAACQQRKPASSITCPPRSLATAAAEGPDTMQVDSDEPADVALLRDLACRAVQGSGGSGSTGLGPRRHSLKRSSAAPDAASQRRVRSLLEHLLRAQAAAQAAGQLTAAQSGAARAVCVPPSGSATPDQRTGSSPAPSATPQSSCMSRPAEAAAATSQPADAAAATGQTSEQPAQPAEHRRPSEGQQAAAEQPPQADGQQTADKQRQADEQQGSALPCPHCSSRRSSRQQLAASMTGIQATVAAALERLSLLDSMLNQLVRLASSSASASAAGGRRAAGACRSSKLGTLPASPQLAPDTPQRGGDGSER